MVLHFALSKHYSQLTFISVKFHGLIANITSKCACLLLLLPFVTLAQDAFDKLLKITNKLLHRMVVLLTCIMPP